MTVVLGLVLGAACGGESSAPEPESPGLEIATWNTMEVYQESAARSMVRVTRLGGFADSVKLAVAGLPEGVSAEFTSPAYTNQSRVGYAELWVRAIAGAEVGEKSVLVTATAPGLPQESASMRLKVLRYCGGYYWDC